MIAALIHIGNGCRVALLGSQKALMLHGILVPVVGENKE
jgi:hypothetical protein